MEHPFVSIIMPAYNVANSIVDVVMKAKQVMTSITDDYEIIVVNDGSRDATRAVLESLRDSRLKIVDHKDNLGKGAAIKTGVKYANGVYTILLDADGDIDITNITPYLRALRKYDIVVGSKRHPRSTYQAPFLRKILSLGYNTLVKILLGIRVRDTQTGFKAFKTKYLKLIMKVIIVKRYSWDAEALAVANLLKLRITEEPIHIRQEKQFKIKDCLEMLLEILGVLYRLRISRWYQKKIEEYINTK
jgi:glycosyltransferase involved in cell wall biosynthesis